MNSSVRSAIAAIPEDAWTAISYPQAIWDDQLECWVCDAEVAEARYTAFTSKPKKEQVTARLIVRRGPRPQRQGGARARRAVPRLAAPRRPDRLHPVTSPRTGLARPRSHNLLRAAGTRTGTRYARARTATIRRDLIAMPARIARRGRGNLVLRLPADHHREQPWLNLWTEACGPPAAAA